MHPLPPKLTRPRIAGSLVRRRLFSPLDRARRSGGVVWVQGQPGAGKTTLVASWLAERRVPAIWFAIDRADADAPTFFHHLKLSVRDGTGRRATLPDFTVACCDDLHLFARRWFRRFYAALRHGTVVVFDDYHELPPEAPVHDVLRVAVEERPHGIGLVISSRGEPPTALARLKAYGGLTALGTADLELTPAEAWALARKRRFGGTRAQVEALRQRMRGWAAGFVLLTAGASRHASEAGAHEATFDFFSGEIFDRFDPRTRRILLEAALLDAPTAEVLESATGDLDASRVLSGLARRGLFTLERPGERAAFEFHALFRQFLLYRGRAELPPGRAGAVRRAAARALASRGGSDAERALALFVEAGEHQEAVRVITREAPSAMAAGRTEVVRRWIEAIPEAVREAEPWLLYWAGTAAAARDPRTARRLLGHAFDALVARNDADGAWLAWAGVVEAILIEAADLSLLDGWLAELPKVRERFPLPSPQVNVQVTLAVLAALVHHAPEHPELAAWADAGRAIALDESQPERIRLRAGTHYLLYVGWWMGDASRSTPVVAALAPLARRAEADPGVAVLWLTVEAPYHAMVQDAAAGERTVAEARARAKASGVHAWDVMLHVQALWSALGADDLPAARALVARVSATVEPGNAMDRAMHRTMEALVALRSGDVEEAERSAREAVTLAERTGHAICNGMAMLALARAAREDGGATIAAARAALRRIHSPPLEHILALVEAERALGAGDRKGAVEALRRALRLQERGAAHGQYIFSARELAPLCAAALEHGVEPAAARRIISARRVPPAPEAGERWPRSIHLRTLGRFDVRRDGVPVGEGKRGANKPLELLKVLVAHGGRSVGELPVAEALWPEADGDCAHHALETTVYRLRRFVGQDAIVQRGGKLSLSRECCWVDALELEDRIASALRALESRHRPGKEQLAAAAARIVELYRGPFLDGHDATWAVNARRRQRRALARWLDAMAAAPGVDVAAIRRRLRDADPDLEAAAPFLEIA